MLTFTIKVMAVLTAVLLTGTTSGTFCSILIAPSTGQDARSFCAPWQLPTRGDGQSSPLLGEIKTETKMVCRTPDEKVIGLISAFPQSCAGSITVVELNM